MIIEGEMVLYFAFDGRGTLCCGHPQHEGIESSHAGRMARLFIVFYTTLRQLFSALFLKAYKSCFTPKEAKPHKLTLRKSKRSEANRDLMDG